TNCPASARFVLHTPRGHRHLPSFPTRRSSDLEPSLHGSDDEPEQQHDDQRDQWRNALPDHEHPEQRGRQSAQLRQGQIDLAEEQDEVDAQSEDREERDLGGEVDEIGWRDEIAVGGLEHDDDDDEREDDRERPELALFDPSDERADQSLAGDPLIGDEGVAGHRRSPLRAALWVTTLSLAPVMAATSTSVR